MNNLLGKIAVVSGGASGLGKATAHRLASQGATVILGDIQAEAAAKVARDLAAEFGQACRALALDCGNAQSCQAFVDDIVAHEGGIHIVCNVAGVLDGGHTTTFDPARWDRLIQINLSGPFYLTHAALPHLVKAGGSVVNISSTAGLTGHAYLAAYCASKHGVIGLTRSLAAEFAHQGVTVNGICPGQMDTSMVAPFMDEDLDLSLLSRLRSLTGQINKPSDIAGMVAFLVSEEARNTTGAVIAMDGGQTTA